MTRRFFPDKPIGCCEDEDSVNEGDERSPKGCDYWSRKASNCGLFWVGCYGDGIQLYDYLWGCDEEGVHEP